MPILENVFIFDRISHLIFQSPHTTKVLKVQQNLVGGIIFDSWKKSQHLKYIYRAKELYKALTNRLLTLINESKSSNRTAPLSSYTFFSRLSHFPFAPPLSIYFSLLAVYFWEDSEGFLFWHFFWHFCHNFWGVLTWLFLEITGSNFTQTITKVSNILSITKKKKKSALIFLYLFIPDIRVMDITCGGQMKARKFLTLVLSDCVLYVFQLDDLPTLFPLLKPWSETLFST